MGLVIGQSDKKKQRYRLRVKGRHAKRITLTTFRYYSSEMAIVRTTGRNSVPLETVLAKWNELVPLNVAEEQPTEQECKRRPNVVWTQAAATKVLDMVDLTKTNCRLVSVCLFAFQSLYVFVHYMCVTICRYSLSQIAEQLNCQETEHLYKHPRDHVRNFTAGNVQAFLKRVFPSQDDTQAAVEMLGSYVCRPVSADPLVKTR